MWEAQRIVNQLRSAFGEPWVIQEEIDNGVFLATVNRDFADEARRNKNAQRRVEWDGRSWLIDAVLAGLTLDYLTSWGRA